MNEQLATIARLRRQRPRSRFLRLSGLGLAALVATSWLVGGFLDDPGWSPRRAANVERFLGDCVPWPLRESGWDTGALLGWLGGLWRSHLQAATLSTLAISVAAILLAGLLGGLVAPWAARTFACPEPYLTGPRDPARRRRVAWSLVVVAARAVLTLLRSIPEYVWAFLLLALYGPGAWPLVLALALHNAGILGKLGGDVVENLPPARLAGLRGLGATRAQLGLAGVFPLVINRFLLFLCYRWETCVREATVLGMLGGVSLGYWVQDARARHHHDELVLVLLLGAMLVILGDLVSYLLRDVVRRA